MHEVDNAISKSGAPGHFMAGPIFHISKLYMDFVAVLNILLDLSSFYFACFNGC